MHLTRVATAVLTVVGLGGLALVAAPAASAHDVPGQALTVNVTGDGATSTVLSGSTWLRPGYLTIRIKDSTSPDVGAQITVVSMIGNAPVSQLLADIAVQAGNGNSTPAQNAASTTDINKIAKAYGGPDVYPAPDNGTRSVTDFLPRDGTYYLISTGSPSAGPTVLQTLHVLGHGDFDDARAPRSASTVFMGNGSADTFVTSTGRWLPREGTIKIRNNGDSVHLFQISKVADGTTDAAVQAEYDTVLAGGMPTSDPANLMGSPTPSTGADALTPGQVASLTYDLPRGTYLIQCFIADSMTGIPHTFMGMHLIVHLG
jgi:hypothetical protein